ncbi:glycosyltransferase [Kocuria sabuli]|uniref:glycosyltransferase n=1 Tax=Kocuria sabuli TaxID=3071448 RepID=UPI0034D542E8
MELSVIVPTFNEAPNVSELVGRVEAACKGLDAEVVFVDDSRDDTPEVIRRVASSGAMRVRLIHRDVATGGRGGAVIEGIRSSQAEHCMVMDGNLEHPPEMIPVILERLRNPDTDVVVASRFCGRSASVGGPASAAEKLVSSACRLLSRSLFPVRLKDCNDPMTGFFGFRRSTVDVERLKPTGFKILLEILTRNRFRVAEVPFVFGERFAGESRAWLKEGLRFIHQVTGLRFGRIASFGLVGAIGTVLNLLIMGVLVASGMHYVLAAVIAAETTILSNFLMQERMVFRADRRDAQPIRRRALQSFTFNNVEAAARLPFLWGLVEFVGMSSLVAQAGTLAVAFILRYLFHSRVVYGMARPSPIRTAPVQVPVAGVNRLLRRQRTGLTPRLGHPTTRPLDT